MKPLGMNELADVVRLALDGAEPQMGTSKFPSINGPFPQFLISENWHTNVRDLTAGNHSFRLTKPGTSLPSLRSRFHQMPLSPVSPEALHAFCAEWSIRSGNLPILNQKSLLFSRGCRPSSGISR